MGIVLRQQLIGEGAIDWLPVAKAHLAAMNARANASFLHTVLNYAGARIVILRGTVVDAITITMADPYLLVAYSITFTGGAGIAWAAADDPGGTTYTNVGFTNETGVVQLVARMPYAGDDFVLLTQANSGAVEANTDTSWSAMAHVPFFGTVYEANDPARLKHSTVFDTVMGITGLVPSIVNIAGTPTGWKDDATRFRFAFSATYWTDDTNPTTRDATRVPIVFAGNTAQQALTQHPYPYFANYRHLFDRLFCIGPGKLQALQCTDWAASQAASLATVDPYLTLSTDHGESWGLVDTSFLAPFLYYNQPGTGDAQRTLNITRQLGAISQSVLIYLGNDREMLIVPSCWIDMLGVGGQPRFAALAFLGSAGAGYTRVPWLMDTVYVSANGSPLADDRVLFAGQAEDARNGQYAFGVNCMYVPVKSGGFYRVLYTHDAGITWVFSPPLPDIVIGPNGAVCGAVIEPFVSDSVPGKIVFAAPDYANNRMGFRVTDGTFASFTPSTQFAPAVGGTLQFPLNTAWYNYAVTNFGKTAKRFVYPAFPGKFEKPAP